MRLKGDLQNFLNQYPGISPLAEEAMLHAAHQFPGATLDLRLETDPESGERQAVLWIAVSASPRDAFRRLTALDEAWWLDNMHRAGGKFHLNVEFKDEFEEETR